MYPRLIRTQRIRPWFLYTPPVAICDGFHVELSGDEYFGQLRLLVKIEQYLESRRDRSRNKVAVGEPAAGSFMMLITNLPVVNTLMITTTKLDVDCLNLSCFLALRSQ